MLNTEYIQQQLAKLREEFASSLLKRVDQMISDLNTLQANANSDTGLQKIFRQIHSMSGSAATFGFVQLSEDSRQLELIIKDFINNHTFPDAKTIDNLNNGLKNLHNLIARGPDIDASDKTQPNSQSDPTLTQKESLQLVNLDITQRKLAEKAMEQATEEANRQKSAFLNIMSHELRTPLTVILGYLPILQDLQKMPSPETIKQIAEDMNFSGQHLLALINDLLDLSKIEAGQMNLSIETVQSLPLTQDMLRKFNNQANQKGIELINKTSDFSFQVDERRLQQILINLMSNALKFTEHGSIEISAEQVKQTVVFTIKDTGIGIAEPELLFIFDTFRQVDDTSTRNTGGSGLGLAISKRLVELHGGTISVESEPGSGTTFTFSIKQ